MEVDASVHSLRSVGSGLLLEKVSQQPYPSASGVAGRTERKVEYSNLVVELGTAATAVPTIGCLVTYGSLQATDTIK